MFYFQAIVVALSSLLFGYLLFRLLKKFNRQDVYIYFIVPIFMYGLGFIMRLSDNEKLINLGYFFTEGTFVVIYIVFSISFLLGQLKYWKK